MTSSRVLILGGGLAGLHTASRLQALGVDWQLLEARPTLGGRIRTLAHSSADLGPAWFWPHQGRMAALIDALGLGVYPQHAAGDALWEHPGGEIQRQRGTPPPPSLRIEGGVGALVDALANPLPEARLHLGTPVSALVRTEARWRAETTQDIFEADHLVVALPPRILAPLLPTAFAALSASLSAQQTWMAGQAKCVARFARPFWRAQGLSGDAFSRRGPMIEIHDASGPDGTDPALFGFLGVPAAARAEAGIARIREACVQQLTALFGDEAKAPLALEVQDWAEESFTATQPDLEEMPAHAHFDPAPHREVLASNALYLAGSEFARQEPGYLEGALEASSAAVDALLHHL